MSRMLIALATLAGLTMVAAAQTTSPTESAPAASSKDTAAAPKTDTTLDASAGAKPADSSSEAADNSKSGSGDTANQETYKMKNGQMYQPPKIRPPSPAQDLNVYGRT